MAKIDPRFGNNSGYFKDPSNGEDLSPDTPRVIPCSFENGKFVWPQVSFENGDMGKIVYKLFTDEEKDLYKEYRGRGSGERPKKNTAKHTDSGSTSSVDSNSTDSTTNDRYTYLSSGKVIDNETGEFVTPPKQKGGTKHHIDAAISAKSLEIVRSCNKLLGINNICGIDYAVLCHSSDTHTLYHIPRQCIPDSEMERLGSYD